MKFSLVKDGNYGKPATEMDEEKFKKVKQGEIFGSKTVNQRNYKLLQKYWVLMDFAFKNLPEKYDGYWAVVEDFEEEVLIAIGWKKITKDFHGNEKTKAKSISYENLPDDVIFQEIYSRCLGVICRMIGVPETDIMDELIGFM